MKKKYRKVFSRVTPDEKTIERILDMKTEKRISFKPLLVAAAIIIAGVVGMFSANAATDGELFEDVKTGIETGVESVKKSFVGRIVAGGKELTEEDVTIEYNTEVDEDGKTVERVKIYYPQNGSSYELLYEIDEEGVGIKGSGDIPEDFHMEYNDGTEDKVLDMPTTAVAE